MAPHVAINAVAAMCRVPEDRVCHRGRPARLGSSAGQPSHLEGAKSTLTGPDSPSRVRAIGPTQCIVCIGNKGLALRDRIKSFHSVGHMRKHFRRKHLRHCRGGQSILCGLCGMACRVTVRRIFKTMRQERMDRLHKIGSIHQLAELSWLGKA